MLYLKTLTTFSFILLFGINISLYAQSTWTGAVDGDWSNPGNWDTAPQNGDNLIFNGTAGALDNNNALSSVGDIDIVGGGWEFTGSPLTLNGNVRLTSGSGDVQWGTDLILASGTRQFRILTSNKVLDITGQISGSGTIQFRFQSSIQGTLRLSNTNNSFTGNLSLQAGRTEFVTLADAGQNSSMGAGQAVSIGTSGSGISSNFVYIGGEHGSTNRELSFVWGGVASNPSYQFVHNNNSDGGNLSFTNTGAIGISGASEDNLRYITFSGTSTGITTIDGSLTNRWVGLRVFQNAGVVRLTANNTYHRETLVESGTLWVEGDQSGSLGDVVVGVEGVLGGSGVIGGETFVSGAIAPGGESIRTLTILNHVTWNGAESAGDADWQFRLGENGESDRLVVGGSGYDFNKGTNGTFRFDFLGTGSEGEFTLLTWTGSTNFDESDFSYVNLDAGLAGEFAIVGSSLMFTVIPEPSTYVLGLGSLLFVVMLLRRRAGGFAERR